MPKKATIGTATPWKDKKKLLSDYIYVCSLFEIEFQYMEDKTNVGDFCSGTYPQSSFHSFFFVIFLSDNMECTDMRHQPARQTYIGFHSAIFIYYCCIMKRNNTFLQTFPKSSIKNLHSTETDQTIFSHNESAGGLLIFKSKRLKCSLRGYFNYSEFKRFGRT
jgi:hypothetical protein